MIAESKFDHGKVVEIRLYPVDLGYGMKLTESGTPRLAGPEASQRILSRVQEMSQKYGTKITIEGSVGVVSSNNRRLREDPNFKAVFRDGPNFSRAAE